MLIQRSFYIKHFDQPLYIYIYIYRTQVQYGYYRLLTGMHIEAEVSDICPFAVLHEEFISDHE